MLLPQNFYLCNKLADSNVKDINNNPTLLSLFSYVHIRSKKKFIAFVRKRNFVDVVVWEIKPFALTRREKEHTEWLSKYGKRRIKCWPLGKW
jgi:hypothetical protein